PERFRFDFSHLEAMKPEELQKVQGIVNERIRQNLPVQTRVLPYKEAVASGAIALFEEEYGETVRVLRVGEPPVSTELCGGTHVSATGEIGFFIIVSESSIGAGLRRIEAVTGRGAEAYINQRFGELAKIAEALETKPESLLERATSLAEELRNERRLRQTLEGQLSRRNAETLLSRAEVLKGVTVLAASVPSTRPEILREMGDFLRDKLRSAVIVLGTSYQDKPLFLAMVTPDLVAKGYHAGNIIKQVARVAGGGGGGKAELAQAGGRFADKLDEALGLVKSLI
ncbi:MAG: DHHA1 domain-containing protein, partial [Chloroflexota bacterium]